jgi:hypothetical protein
VILSIGASRSNALITANPRASETEKWFREFCTGFDKLSLHQQSEQVARFSSVVRLSHQIKYLQANVFRKSPIDTIQS